MSVYAGADYRVIPTLVMTLRKLKLIATIVPIAALVALELARYVMIGEMPVRYRFVLDAVALSGIIVFSMVIFRFVGSLQAQLRRQNNELLALHQAGLAVAAELSLDSVLKTVVDQARSLIGAKYGAVSVIDREGRIQQFVTAGVSPEERAAIGPPPVGHGVLGVVLHDGEHLRLADVARHPRSQGFPPNHPIMRTLLAVPIQCSSPFLGNLYLSEKENGEQFSEYDQQTLERLAVQAGIAIDNAHLHVQAADLAVAQERLRIAHEMHDGLAQVLGYVNTKVQAADAYLKRGMNEEASGQLQQLAVSAREAYAEVREGIVGLRTLPDADQGVAEALRNYLNQWKEQSGISAELVVDDDMRVPPSVELQLIRIVQEALTNVRKHSKASRASVSLVRDGQHLIVTVADDGVGFDPAAKTRAEFPRFGLATMRERAETVGGTVSISSSRGSGTTVRFELPLRDQE
ncbi:MAG TPA: GAF domain-containing sensor histidine kinase [Thermoanaerobaculia bacterium]